MARCLFGVETEYSVTMLDASQSAVHDPAADLVGLAGKTMRVLSDGGLGYFLENGGRLYSDAGSPEYSTPECIHPDDLVRHVHAGNRILQRLAGIAATSSPHVREAIVLRCNVNYGDVGITWGCHESYLHRRSPQAFPAQIIPHLASRIVYSGAGGFDNRHPHQVAFTVSPRALYMEHDISDSSIAARGIYHRKDETLSRSGYHRLHIICGESLCSELALWLKVGATALVVALIDAGRRPGEEVQLSNAVQAMHRFALDRTCRDQVLCADGVRRSAIDIQRHYLSAVERHLGANFMPDWAPEVCARWAAVLDRLEQGPHAAAAELDWAIKLALFEDHIESRGFDWPLVARWNRALDRVPAALAAGAAAPSMGASADATRAIMEESVARHGLRVADLARFIDLRDSLCALDIHFGDLGDDGVFNALDQAGVLRHRVVTAADIERAVAKPPPGSRARLRGEHVRRLQRGADRYTGAWDAIVETDALRYLDLGDPFAERAVWQPAKMRAVRRTLLRSDFTPAAARRAALRRLRAARYRQGMQFVDCALLLARDQVEVLRLRLLTALARYRLGQRRRARALLAAARRRAAPERAGAAPVYFAARVHQIAADLCAGKPRAELLDAIAALEREPHRDTPHRAAPLLLLRSRIELASGNLAAARELARAASSCGQDEVICFELEDYCSTLIECSIALREPECPLAESRQRERRRRLRTICEAACAAQHGRADTYRAAEHARNALQLIEANENEAERLLVARFTVRALLAHDAIGEAEAALERFATLRNSEVAEHRYHMEILYGDLHMRRGRDLLAIQRGGHAATTARRRSAALWYVDRARRHYHAAARLAVRLDTAFVTTWRGDRAQHRLATQRGERVAMR